MAMQAFVNVFGNEAVCVLCFIQSRLWNEMKESTHTADNEFEAMSVGFVLGQCAKANVTLSAIQMTSSSCDIYFHTLSRNQTKL